MNIFHPRRAKYIKNSFCFENLEQKLKKSAPQAKILEVFNIRNIVFNRFSFKFGVNFWKKSASGGIPSVKKAYEKLPVKKAPPL